MENKQLLKIEEVAVLLGVSVKTINNWYWFKRENPDDEFAKILPNYIQEGERQTRYWRFEDLIDLQEFKKYIPRGRNGVMSKVTQKYLKNKKENENE